MCQSVPRKLYLSGVLFLCLLLPACGQVTDQAYALLLKGLYSHTVPVIPAAKLKPLLEKETHPVLLDTRSEKEYHVSHLTGAKLVNYDNFDLAQLKDVPKDTPIVVYCSVGYRSEKIGERLQQAGYSRVQNLYGGLFEWVNQGHPVYNQQGKTNQVHAYSKSWGVWLRKGEKVYD
ncbi:rhodanese-like domain-containing protein [Pontibacter roseus]|uniref:rhodanese-like domain-containing protein n=1 Tax=Pontibacter roseus TaxID=336989 RepID=UPI00036B82B2|nr:rhodanese-like domain-containing protein [Pontibacter roseus]